MNTVKYALICWLLSGCWGGSPKSIAPSAREDSGDLRHESTFEFASSEPQDDELTRALEKARKVREKLAKGQAKAGKNLRLTWERLEKEFTHSRERLQKTLQGEGLEAEWQRELKRLDAQMSRRLRAATDELEQSSKYARQRLSQDLRPLNLEPFSCDIRRGDAPLGNEPIWCYR